MTGYLWSMITGLDFIGIPSTDADRLRAFYVGHARTSPRRSSDYEFWVGETCFGIWEPDKQGMEFSAEKCSPPGLSRRRHQGSQGRTSKGVTFFGTPSIPGSVTWRSSPIPTAIR